MRRLVPLLMLTLATAGQATGVLAAAESLDDRVTATETEQIRELLSEGVKQYRIGRRQEAAVSFRRALEMDPSDRLLYHFYLSVGDELMHRMMEDGELREVIKDIWGPAYFYRKQLRRDDRYINKLVSLLGEENSEKTRLAATRELIAVGPLATPFLVDKLGDARAGEFKVFARIVLTRMGYRAVLPLIEALNADDPALQEAIVVILKDIADARALPKLVQLRDDENTGPSLRMVCEKAVEIIAEARGLSTVPNAAQLYFSEALRYFREGDDVRDEVVSNESLLWRWVEDPGRGLFALQHVTAPRYSWNESMAEELLYDGMKYFPEYPEYSAYQPLMAATFAAQYVEVHLRERIARDRVVPSAEPEDHPNALAARIQALEEQPNRVRLFGPVIVYRALQECLVSERYEAGLFIMELLRDRNLAQPGLFLPSKKEGLNPGKAGSVLVAALQHPEKRVRYQAAVTLAHLDPADAFFNAERVIPLLAEAVGEWAMDAILVVESDFRFRNAARATLLDQGILAFSAGDGYQARARLNESPVKDAIVIAGDMQPAVRDEYGQLIDIPEQTVAGLVKVLRDDPRTTKTPIFIALPENRELASKVREQFEARELREMVQGFVQRPYSGVEIRGMLEQATGDDELPQLNRAEREAISLAACEALGVLDVTRTQFNAFGASKALAETALKRSDEIRIAAMRALGNIADRDQAQIIVTAYTDQAAVLETKPEVRAAFIYAIGKNNPHTPDSQAILIDALKADEAAVREAAARAIGYSETTTIDERATYLQQERPDARAVESGVEAE